MWGRIGLTLLGALAFAVSPATAASLYTVPKYAAILINSDNGEVLYARQADATRFPASITKVMTLYVIFEELRAGNIRENDQVRISSFAARQPPSKLGLKPGATISVREAMGVIATRSANDISVAMAEYISGSETEFAARMTRTAKRLGMTRTTFRNASGRRDARAVSMQAPQASTSGRETGRGIVGHRGRPGQGKSAYRLWRERC